MNSVWWDLWASFKAVSGPILSGVAFVLALLGPWYAPDATVRIGLIWLAVGGLIAIVILLTAGNMVAVTRRQSRGMLPRVRSAFVDELGPGGSDKPVTLLLDRSELFGINNLVTVYYTEHVGPGRDEVFEMFIGIGRVDTIQPNGRVQILVIAEMADKAELWQRIRKREPATLGQIVVRPSISINEAGLGVRSYE